jgi:hypothetical protein
MPRSDSGTALTAKRVDGPDGLHEGIDPLNAVKINITNRTTRRDAIRFDLDMYDFIL